MLDTIPEEDDLSLKLRHAWAGDWIAGRDLATGRDMLLQKVAWFGRGHVYALAGLYQEPVPGYGTFEAAKE